MKQHQWHLLPPAADPSVSSPEASGAATINESNNINNNTVIPEGDDDMLRCQPFITKLLSILEDKNNRNLISWSLCGDFFRIFDCDEFSRVVLPRYFRHCNWTSFVRQLNMYDFHKLSDTNLDPNNTINTTENNSIMTPWEFKHENFRRNSSKGRLSLIKRKKPKDHTILHIQYAGTMRIAESSSSNSSSVGDATVATSSNSTMEASNPSANFHQHHLASSLEMYGQLENQLGILSSSFDGLIQNLAGLRSVIELQNETISTMKSFVQKMAQIEPRESNPPPYPLPTQLLSTNDEPSNTIKDRAIDSVTGVYQQQYYDRSRRFQPIMMTGTNALPGGNMEQRKGRDEGGGKGGSGGHGSIIDKAALKSINMVDLSVVSMTTTSSTTSPQYSNLVKEATTTTTPTTVKGLWLEDDGLSKKNPSQEECDIFGVQHKKKKRRSTSPLSLTVDKQEQIDQQHNKKGFSLEFILQKNSNNHIFDN